MRITLALVVLFVTGCVDPFPPNPSPLWLAPADTGPGLQLVPAEPPPFSPAGIGSAQTVEAPIALDEDTPAGTYHVTLDAVIVQPVDMQLALVWRTSHGDRTLAAWAAHYDPLPGGTRDVQAFEYDEPAAAVTVSGDYSERFLLRYTATAAGSGDAYIPNGGMTGRIPNIVLPSARATN